MAIDDMPLKLVKVDLAPLKLFALGVFIFLFLFWFGGRGEVGGDYRVGG